MKTKNARLKSQLLLCLLLLSTLNPQLSTLFAQGSAFTYQGQLNNSGNPATGIYDLRFTIYDSTNNPGVIIAGPLTNSAAGVSNGLFTVALDFGTGVFTGPDRWLEIGVRTNGGASFTAVSPRQQLTPTPYAVFANTASNVSGTISSAAIFGTYGNAVNFNNGANNFDGTFTGQFFGSTFTGGLFTGAFIGSGAGLGDVWHTTGNYGTTPGVSFLGTADNQPLDIRVNNQRVFRFQSSTDINAGIAPNIIGGHVDNSISPDIGGSVIGGGGGNGLANAIWSAEDVIAGGYLNYIEGGNAHASVIGGGFDNTIQFAAPRAVIAGGHANRIGTNSWGGVIGGGEINALGTNAIYGTIAGGSVNTVLANTFAAAVGGGYQNTAGGNFSTIAGGYLNSSGGYVSSIGGGQGNTNQGSYAFIGGGAVNAIQLGAAQAVLGGGSFNKINSNAPGSVIVGGTQNLIQSNASGAIIVGGLQNTNASLNAFVGGGVNNSIRAGSDQAVIGGGTLNVVHPGSLSSVIPGGYNNFVSGSYSFAGGSYAQAVHNGTFVWSDNSSPTYFSSSSSNQFLVRATGGVVLQAGTVTVPGLLRSGSELGTSEPPSPAGLVARRINSTSQSSGLVVARTDTLTLERDGTTSGLLVRYPASPGRLTINVLGVNNVGAAVSKHYALNNPGVAGTQQLFTQPEHVTHAQISFGITYNAAQHMTQVVLDRYDDGVTDDWYWMGTLTSTFNQ